MAAVKFSNLHPDFRLGLLLVAAALLLDAGGSGALWGPAASDRLGLSSSQFGWLTMAGGLGALFVVAAVIWVDRRPPHGMMAAGAGVLALGLLLATLSDGFGLAVTSMFLTGAGGAFVGSLVFYVVAVKGSTRFRGALIGALALVFNVSWGGGPRRLGGSHPNHRMDGLPGPGGWDIAPSASPPLVHGPLRTGSYPQGDPGCSRGQAEHRLGSGRLPGCGYGHDHGGAPPPVGAPGLVQDAARLEYEYRLVALAGGTGALLWGIASDFLPVRWLLMALAVVFLLAALSLWLSGGDGTDVLILALVRGGLISLPWVLMAESLPARHFAKLALAVSWVGSQGGALSLFYRGLALYAWGGDSFPWIVIVEVCALAAVVAFRPRPAVTSPSGNDKG